MSLSRHRDRSRCVRAHLYPPTFAAHQEKATSLSARLRPMTGTLLAPALSLRTVDYLELVDWSGRIVREGKRGAIAATSSTECDSRCDGDNVQWIGCFTTIRFTEKGGNTKRRPSKTCVPWDSTCSESTIVINEGPLRLSIVPCPMPGYFRARGLDERLTRIHWLVSPTRAIPVTEG